MEEGEYRRTYHAINQQRCLFEKSVLSRNAHCHHAHRFCLADREGVACQSPDATGQCRQILDSLRNKAAFALQMSRIEGPLPHAKEVKVQMGGLIGLSLLVQNATDESEKIADIHALISNVVSVYGTLDSLPYDEIARSITKYKSRKRAMN